MKEITIVSKTRSYVHQCLWHSNNTAIKCLKIELKSQSCKTLHMHYTILLAFVEEQTNGMHYHIS